MRQSLRCNIVDITNQLFFAYQELALELRVFVSSPTKSTKASNFIQPLEEKQKIWYKMMTVSSAPQRYYSPAQKPSAYKLSLPNQSEFFTCFSSQQGVPQAQPP